MKTKMPFAMAKQANLSDPQPEVCPKPQDDLEIRSSLDPDTYKFLKIIEARFDCELRNQQRALSQMPQRLISEEVKEALKKSIEQDLKAEIQQELKPQLGRSEYG